MTLGGSYDELIRRIRRRFGCPRDAHQRKRAIAATAPQAHAKAILVAISPIFPSVHSTSTPPSMQLKKDPEQVGVRAMETLDVPTRNTRNTRNTRKNLADEIGVIR